MRIDVQWATNPASGFVQTTEQAFTALPKRAAQANTPTFSISHPITGNTLNGTLQQLLTRLADALGTEAATQYVWGRGTMTGYQGSAPNFTNPGWLCRMRCQGIELALGWDHVQVTPIVGGVEFLSWLDSLPFSGAAGAMRWRLYDEIVTRTDLRNGVTITQHGPRQEQTLWVRTADIPSVNLLSSGGPVQVLDYATFVAPADTTRTRHGIWQPTAQLGQHLAVPGAELDAWWTP